MVGSLRLFPMPLTWSSGMTLRGWRRSGQSISTLFYYHHWLLYVYCPGIVENISCSFLFVSAVHVFHNCAPPMSLWWKLGPFVLETVICSSHGICLWFEDLFCCCVRYMTQPLCCPGTTVVCVTTGACVSVVSTPRPLGGVERLLVCQRRDKILEDLECLEYPDICALLHRRMFSICRIDEPIALWDIYMF